jgi:HSP20 family molecular chaperone IbpA
MERIIEGIYRETSEHDDQEKIYSNGFKQNSDYNDKSNINILDDIDLTKSNEEKSLNEHKESLTDIIENGKEIFITTELPEIDSNNIKLNLNKNKLEIKADFSQGKYKKVIDLPCDIKPKIKKMTFKNGLLDVILIRKHKKHKFKGYRVNIE